MLHLICLRCGQANAADAKFCGECGGALLRKFCADCHAVNDAESHFCRSCGAALPAQPPTPAAAPAVASMPDTIEVAHAQRPSVHLVTPTPLPLSSIVELPPQWPAAPQTSTLAPKMHALAYRPSLLLGFTGAAAALLVFASWPRFDHTRASGGEQPSAPVTSNTNAAVKAAPVSLTPAVATTAAMPTPATAAAPANIDSPRVDMAASPAPIAAMPRAESRPLERRATPEAMLAAHPPAAGPPRAQPERALTTTRRAPAAPPECTPQVDALGLCAPGAKVIGR